MKILVLATVLATFLAASPPSAALDRAEIMAILADQAKVSERDLAKMGDGFIAKEIPVEDRSTGLALIGLMRLDVTTEQLHASFARAGEAIGEGQEVSLTAFNIVPDEVPDDLFAQYALTKTEKEALETCEVGDCRVKLPQSLIDTVEALDYDWEEDAEAFTQAYRVELTDMVRNYQTLGNAGLWTYLDKPEPLTASDGYRQTLDTAQTALRVAPDVVTYLADYPDAPQPGNVEDFLFWSVMDFGQRPTLMINHAVSVQPSNDDIESLVAIKSLYANHYFSGRATFGVLLAKGVLDEQSPVFVLVDHLHFDGELNRIARRVVSRGIVADIENRLRFIRTLATQ